MNAFKTLFTAAGIVAGFAAQSYACDVEHSLSINMPNPSDFYTLRVNGLLVNQGGHDGSLVPLDRALVSGKNDVTILYETFIDGSRAEFALFEGCQGETPTGAPIATLRLNGEETKTITFRQTAVDGEIYPGAEASDGSGLTEAIQQLQQAVQNRDDRAIFAMHDPLFAFMRAEGMPLAMINAHVSEVIKSGEIEMQSRLTIKPTRNPAVWEVRGPNGTPLVSVTQTLENGSNTWQTGTFWVYADGAWAVLEP